MSSRCAATFHQETDSSGNKFYTHTDDTGEHAAAYPVSEATSFASSSVQAENIGAGEDPTSWRQGPFQCELFNSGRQECRWQTEAYHCQVPFHQLLPPLLPIRTEGGLWKGFQ